MTYGFSGDLFSGGGSARTSLSGMPSFRQPPQQPPQQQQQQPQQQQGMLLPMDQIAQRRADLLMGKRSFGDFQAYQQQVLQQQQQYLMRSVKQRTHSFSSSPISPLSSSIDLCSSASNNHSLSSASARYGVPVYQQLRQQQQQQQQQKQHAISLLTNKNICTHNNNNNNNHHLLHHNQFNPTNNCLISNLSATPNNNLTNPIQGPNPGFPSRGYSNLVQPKLEPQPDNFSRAGYSNLVQPKPEPQPGNVSGAGHSSLVSNPVEPKVEADSENHKILNTLQELEKQLLNDDNEEENDDVSVITNSEWSETFQNLMSPSGNPNPTPSPSPSPSPNTNHACSSTSGSNNNIMISPSPTSSTSSCCSTSAPSQQQPPPPETLSVKELISQAASAIVDAKNEPAIELLGRLARISNCKGNSEQRLGYYMGNALRSRACPNEISPPVLELYSEDQMQGLYSLYDISPCFKFGLLVANLVMLEAITSALQEGVSRVHVIDFDVGHGAQYVNLLRALAERRSLVGATGSYELKVTVVETEVSNRGVMESVKNGLVKLAEGVGISLRFQGLTRKITEITRESIGCEEGEAVVVNFAFKLYRVPDESVSMENLRDELLRRVKGLNPRAVTLVEQEMNGNTAPFMTRVNESCGYYGALLDSLESTLPKENPDRARVEEGLGRKMANSVACEGRERIERAEVFGKWRARMGMAGFELKPISPSVAESMRAKLNSARGGNPGFTVKEESGGVGFGWMGRTLTVASAWR